MNILVTGANSQIGLALRNQERRNCDKWFFTSLTPGEGIYSLDIANEKQIKAFIKEKEISVIINTAAWTDVDRAELEENREIVKKANADGPKYLAEAAKEVGAKLIHISTDFVFNGQTFFPFTEDRQTLPINYYGKTKLEGETNIIESGCDYLIFRIQGLYSIYKESNYVNKMFRLIKNRRDNPGSPIIGVVDDRITSIMDADILAQMLLDIIKYDEEYNTLANTGIYNFTDKGCGSWYDIAVAIADINFPEHDASKYIQPISCKVYKNIEKAQRGFYYILNTSKFEKDFQYPGAELKSWHEHLVQYFTSSRPKSKVPEVDLWK